MAEEGVVFTISLRDTLTGPIRRMRGELLEQRKTLLDTSKDVVTLETSIKGLERAMVKSAATGNVAAYQRQARDLGLLRTAFDQADKAGLEQAEGIKAHADALEDDISKISAWSGLVVAGGEIALEAALKIGELSVATAKLAIEQSQLKERTIATFDALGKGPEAGKKTFAMLDDLSKVLPQTRAQLADWTRQYEAMGVTDLGQLRTQLTALASAQAIMGDEGMATFRSLEERLHTFQVTTGKVKLRDTMLGEFARVGVNIVDIAAKMNMSTKALSAGLKAGTVSAAKFGDALNAALIDKGRKPLDVLGSETATLGAKFRENIGKLFEDVDVTPFVEGLKELGSIFTTDTESGKAMKMVVTGFFTDVFALAPKVLLAVKHAILGAIIVALQFYLAVRPWIPLIKLVGTTFAIAGALTLTTFVPAIWAGVTALAAMVVAAAIAFAPFVAIAAAVMLVYESFTRWDVIKGWLTGLGAWAKGSAIAVAKAFVGLGFTILAEFQKFGSWAKGAAGAIVTGLVDGIKGGAHWVIAAISGLGNSAITAFKKVFHIASPSRVGFAIGANVGGSVGHGIVHSSRRVREQSHDFARVVVGAVAPRSMRIPEYATSNDRAPRTGRAGGGGGPVVVNATFTFDGGKSGAALEVTEQAVSLIFERLAAEQGLA